MSYLRRLSYYTPSLVQALAGLVQLRSFGLAPIEKNAISHGRVAVMDSPAARCVTDLLCIVFSHLSVQELLAASRTCRSWHTVRLCSAAWPHERDGTVLTGLLLEDSPTMQMYALCHIRDDQLSTRLALCHKEERVKIFQLLCSPHEHVQIGFMRKVAKSPTFLDFLSRVGAIPHLVTLLTRSNLAADVVCVLSQLVHKATFRNMMLQAGALPLLCDLRWKQQQQQHDASTPLLLSIVSTLQLHEQYMQIADPVVRACTKLLSSNATFHNEAVSDLFKLISKLHNPHIQQIVNTPGVINKVVHMLRTCENPETQVECARTIANIVSGSEDIVKVVVEAGAIPLLVRLINTSSIQDLTMRVAWALSNIAGTNPLQRDAVLQAGALSPLLCMCSSKNVSIAHQRIAIWTISNLCRGDPAPDFALVSSALSVLPDLLYVLDDEVLADACWTIVYLSSDPTHIQTIVDSKVTRRLVELLAHTSAAVQVPALRAIGYIVVGNETHVQAVVSCNGLPALLALLGHAKQSIRKDACWVISNVTASHETHIELVIEANIIPPLVTILRYEVDFGIRKEAAWAIVNATLRGSTSQVCYLVRQGIIPCLCNLFTCLDPKIIALVLEGVECVLRVYKIHSMTICTDMVKECGGLDKLHLLMLDGHANIREMARSILAEYFPSSSPD
jgi:importin subunit alpha-1